ncbi:MAG: TIM barrel protein [Actinomycetota bacterium]
MKTISLHVHSFSLRYHLRYRDHSGYDVFEYLREMAGRGFTGVNVSANGVGYRDLCGTTPAHFAAVRSAAADLDMKLELDTSDTRVDNMRTMLEVAAACGADTLRTYTRYTAPLAEVVALTIADLRAIAPLAEQLGITVVLENHEDFTGPVLAHILGEVDHQAIRALYDYGNSQMVGEDPLDALREMAPFIARVHAKDHVMLRGPDGPVVQGVAFGEGRLDVARTTDELYAVGVRRFCFENVWAYRAPLKCDPASLPATACFTWDEPARYLHGDDIEPLDALVPERAAFETGLAAFHTMLNDGGYVVAREAN